MDKALGADYSIWDDDDSTPQQVDFNMAARNGINFVGIKASQACWADEDFIYNWKAAKDAGRPRMAFHFMDWTKPALAQADFFCGMIYKDPPEIFPVLDYECRANAPVRGLAMQDCKVFLERVYYNLRLVSGIYTGYDYWKTFGSGDNYWSQYPLWLAWPSATDPVTLPAPWKRWEFWQFSWVGDGKKYGAESIGLDMDYYNGTIEELNTKYGGHNEHDGKKIIGDELTKISKSLQTITDELQRI